MISIDHFLDTLLSTVRDVVPIASIIFGFQLAVLRRPVSNLKKVLLGFVYVIFGLALFFTWIRNGVVSTWGDDGCAINGAGVFTRVQSIGRESLNVGRLLLGLHLRLFL